MMYTPRDPLTQKEMRQLISSVQLWLQPAQPCARYQEVVNMKNQYHTKYGEEQLYKDFKTAQQRLGRG